MTIIIITICILLLLAYVFDITSSKTKIPSVILLFILGFGVKQIAYFSGFLLPNFEPILPVLGTIGLILIVLEGSLELELNKNNLGMVGKSTLSSLLPLLVLSFGLAFAFNYFAFIDFKIGLANAIPIAVISSSIAIPSAKNLIKSNREFITYESSLSDIFGVIFFNFIALNAYIGSQSVTQFLMQLLIVLIISFVATLALAFLLSKIKHNVKFAPIIILVVLIYVVSKIYHLPALIFILIFGLFLGNLDELTRFKFIQKLKPQILTKEVHKFREVTSEGAFLIRSLFFLLFGYLIEAKELFNLDTIVWALGITAGIFIIRAIFLKIMKLPILPLMYIAPRGLITILLFLSIPIEQQIFLVNKSLIIQVIILTAMVMMVGLMQNKPTKKNAEETPEEVEENKIPVIE